MGPRDAKLAVLAFLVCVLGDLSVGDPMWGGLYPRESSSREVRSLDGLWNFRLAPLHHPDLGFEEEWFAQPLSKTGPVISMAVPSSYNDVTQDRDLRDHIGWAWYDRKFFIPERWQVDHERVFLRIGSAHYHSIIYVNGIQIAMHEGGHLPIKGEMTEVLMYGQENLLTVTINNVLTIDTIPEGVIVRHNDTTKYPPDYFVQRFTFDFFNYAGIHRPVYIYTTPQTFIDDIEVDTNIEGDDGVINYKITVADTVLLKGPKASECSLVLLDKDENEVTTGTGCEGTLRVTEAKLWWPFLMSEDPGYLYTMWVSVTDTEGKQDSYPQRVGIRTIGWNSTSITINNVPIYLQGFGKHEDSDIRGKGLDYPLVVKDFSLLKWMGANSFRTSHYPYAEEIMDMADQEGIMVIDECPAVSLTNFGSNHLETHISVMQEMIRRDKNRPSVIMWSVANEPVSLEPTASHYFKELVNATKFADPSRPATAAINVAKHLDFAAKSLDVIMVNRYYSWYDDTGHLELIENQTINEFVEWHQLHDKPVMISEYGADTIAGLHQSPEFVWSEEYQATLLKNNFKAFNVLRSNGYFVGEMIWNFADFATAQSIGRAAGNKKGVLTRNRQPKLSAHLLRERYHALANVTLYDGLFR